MTGQTMAQPQGRTVLPGRQVQLSVGLISEWLGHMVEDSVNTQC